jgi:hypothetical protein
MTSTLSSLPIAVVFFVVAAGFGLNVRDIIGFGLRARRASFGRPPLDVQSARYIWQVRIYRVWLSFIGIVIGILLLAHP